MKNKIVKYLAWGVAAVLLFSGIEIGLNGFWDAGVPYQLHAFFDYVKISIGIATLGFIAFYKKNVLVINLFFFCAFLFVGDVVFLRTLVKPTDTKMFFSGSYSDGFFSPDENLGYVPIASNQVNSIRITESGDTLYNVFYSIDEYSRRRTGQVIEENDNRFAAFFGGSFVFGEGLDDHETLPTLFANTNDGYVSYNYGLCGYGTNQMMALMESDRLEKEILYKDGVGIYVFIWDHMIRTIGAMSLVTTFTQSHPYYYMEGDSLIRNGSFESAGFLERYEKMKFRQWMGLDYPTELKDNHYELVAKMIEQSYRAFKRKFPSADFYVMVFPGEENKILSYIEEKSIRLLDYSKLFGKDEHRIRVGADWHPNAEGNRIIMEKFNQDFQLISKLN